MTELREEIVKRVPPPPPPEEKEEGGEELLTETISLDELDPPELLTGRKQLDEWLESLRERLGTLLDENKQIRITRDVVSDHGIR
jgi:hypothetical protein